MRQLFPLFLAAGAALWAPSAFGQDAYNWTGFYLGLHGGAGTAKAETDADITGEADLCFFLCATDIPFELEGDDTSSMTGLLGGAQIGADYALGNFVVGVKGDISATDLDGEGSISFLPVDLGGFSDFLASAETETSIDWMATIRGRVGVVGPSNALLYVTGGLAVADVESTFTLTGIGEEFSDPSSETLWGFTIGAGGEAPITSRVSVGLEYLYTELESNGIADISDTAGSIVCPFGCFGLEADFDSSAEQDIHLHTWRAAVNIKLGPVSDGN